MMALSSVFMVHWTAGRKAESTRREESGAPEALTRVCSTSAMRKYVRVEFGSNFHKNVFNSVQQVMMLLTTLFSNYRIWSKGIFLPLKTYFH